MLDPNYHSHEKNHIKVSMGKTNLTLYRSHLKVVFFIHISGKDQVAFGVVPLGDVHQSLQSAKSVRPLAIANCREKRLVKLDKLFMENIQSPIIPSENKQFW